MFKLKCTYYLFDELIQRGRVRKVHLFIVKLNRHSKYREQFLDNIASYLMKICYAYEIFKTKVSIKHIKLEQVEKTFQDTMVKYLLHLLILWRNYTKTLSFNETLNTLKIKIKS